MGHKCVECMMRVTVCDDAGVMGRLYGSANGKTWFIH